MPCQTRPSSGRANACRSGSKVARRRSGRATSPARLAARAAALPVISFPDLPVSEHRQEIAEAIRDHQVVIVSGETGSGKTTQIPKICLQLGRGIGGMIGHTQPRRLAARSVAERIAEELGQTVGQVVGYQVRFTDQVGPTTLVKLMTDGILLNEIQADPTLSKYDTIIVDEAHERTLNIDFILGYLARLLPKRPDLKLIITSATIDSERFASHFSKLLGGPVPVVEVTGRTYPVEIRYRPLAEDDRPQLPAKGAFQQLVLEDPAELLPTLGYGLGEEIDLEQALCDAVDELQGEPDGDILVFLPGERDIREAQNALEDHLAGGWEIIPLFARLSAREQQRIFQPGPARRLILATNIAETSLTVPRIRYVIDSGLARISRFSNKTKVQRLPIEGISQASANQRAGRAGRLSDGIAIRLYSAPEYSYRPEFTDPEILRTSLASVILQMKSLGLGEVADFPFIDGPSPRAVRDGVQQLVEIGALTDTGELTDVGVQLARLPIDPRLGRMLLAGHANGCVSEVVVIIAALSIQDVRERPVEAEGRADQSHSRFADPNSDFVTYLNLWRYLNVQARDLSGAAFRRLCRSEYLHYLRFREWRDVVNQLRQVCRQLKIPVDPLGDPSPAEVRKYPSAAEAVVAYGKGSRAVDYDQLHRSLLVGLLSNVGTWDEPKRNYLGARGTRFTIWPGSGLAGRHPQWVMAAELVETSRLFARTVARIQVEWVEEAAGHLVTRSYSEPYWSRAKGAAMIKERVLLYGLTLTADRPVLLSGLGNREIGAPTKRSAPVPRPGTIAAIAQGLLAETDGAFLQGFVSAREESLTATELAHEMFIREALVQGKWRSGHLKFVQHNKDVLQEARDLEDRLRSPGLVASEEDLARFFAERVPARITSTRSFENWWKKTRRDSPDLLDLRWEDVVREAPSPDEGQFPDHWEQDDLRLALTYDFQPGSSSDGVTVTIPLAVLPQVEDEGFDWLVPGMLRDLCTATIRALPKQKRRHLSPAPNLAEEIAGRLNLRGATTVFAQAPPQEDSPSLDASLDRLQAWADRSGALRGTPSVAPAQPEPEATVTTRFFPAFAAAVRDLRGVELTEADGEQAAAGLPPHLRMHFRVTDDAGRTIMEGLSLPQLQRKLAQKADAAVSRAVKSAVRQAVSAPTRQGPGNWEKQGLTEYPEIPLPRVVETLAPDGLLVRGYPALYPGTGTTVDLRLSSSADLARWNHRKGVARLLHSHLRLPVGRVTTRWSGREALLLASTPYANTEALVEDAGLAAAQALTDNFDADEVRSSADFDRLVREGRGAFEEEIHRVLLTAVKTVEAAAHVQDALSSAGLALDSSLRKEVENTVSRLFSAGFLSATPRGSLDHLPRYLEAAALRVRRATSSGKAAQQDRRKAQVVSDLVAAWRRAAEATGSRPFSLAAAEDLQRIQWLLEELRVSQFAETLGTREKVSPQRVARLLEQVGVR